MSVWHSGVSNILHLGGIKPGTFNSPAVQKRSIAESQQDQLLRIEVLLWTLQQYCEQHCGILACVPRVVPGIAAVVSSSRGFLCPTARLIALTRELFPAF